jgi:hypothetical protein
VFEAFFFSDLSSLLAREGRVSDKNAASEALIISRRSMGILDLVDILDYTE